MRVSTTPIEPQQLPQPLVLGPKLSQFTNDILVFQALSLFAGSDRGGSTGSRTPCLDNEPIDFGEDAVVGHERDLQSQRGGCDPTVCFVDLLSEAMTSAFATRPKRRADLHQLVVRLDDCELSEVVFESSSAEFTPSSLERAVAKFGDGDE